MINEEKNIDKLFNQNLADHGEDMPAYVWDKLDAALKKSKKRVMMIYVRSAAATLAIVLSFLTGYYLTNLDTVSGSSEAIGKVNKGNIKIVNQVVIFEKDSVTNETIQHTAKPELLFQPVHHNFFSKARYIFDLELNVFKPGNYKAILDGNQLTDYIDSTTFNTDTAELKDSLKPVDYNEVVPDDELFASNDSEWSAIGQFSPGITNQSEVTESSLYNNADNHGTNSFTNESRAEIQPDLVLSGGIGGEYSLNNRLTLGTGIYFSKIGANYKLIEVPATLNYYPVKKDILVGVNTGLSNGYLFGLENDHNLMWVNGITVGYRITGNLSLGITPSYKLNIPVTTNYFNSFYKGYFTAYFGLKYSF